MDPAAFKKLYPFQSRYHDIGGLKYHYLDEGKGEPVVCVHGNPTWSFYFREVVQALKSDYRVIVPDHIGCGLSDKPGDERYRYTLKSRINDLESLLDSLKIQSDVTLVLHDWGGAIGMGWATRFPLRVKRIVLLNTAAFFLPPSKPFPRPLRAARDFKLGALLVRGFNAFAWTASRVASRKGLPPEVRQAYLMPYNSWANRIATLRFVQDIPLKPSDASYAVIDEIQESLSLFKRTPKMICWGAHDFVFDDHFLARWREIYPDAPVHRFEDAGHYVLEDAGDRIIPLIKKFIRNS